MSLAYVPIQDFFKNICILCANLLQVIMFSFLQY